MGVQPNKYAPLQTFEAYVPFGAGSLPVPGVPQVVLLPLHWVGGVLYFTYSISVVGFKLGDYGVVFYYQGDNFIHIQLVEYFVAHSQVNPGLVSKLFTLAYFPVEPV